MTRTQRVWFWALAAFWGAALWLVELVVYPDTPAPLRIVYTATVAVYGAVALLSFRARPADPRVRLFVLTNAVITTTWWIYPLDPSPPTSVLRALYLLAYTGVFLLTSPLLLHLGAVLPARWPVEGRRREIVRGGYVATAVALGAAFALYLDAAFGFVPAARLTFDEARAMVRTAVLAFYGVAGLTGGALVLREAMRTPSMAARRQAVALAMALLPFGIFRLSDAAFPALSGAAVYPTLEAIALFLLPLCCFLAIHGFRLFEGGLYLRRGLLLGATLTLMVAGTTIIVVTARAILPDLVDSVEGFAILCIAAGALMVPLARHLGGVLDTLFFPERVALRSLTVGILQRVAEYTDVRMLCGAFSAAMAEGLSLSSAAVYVLDESGATFELAGETGDASAFPRRISAADAAAATASTAPRPFVRAVPIALGGRMVALLGLGPPVSGELFTEAELHEVELTTLQVAAMVENARLFSLATRDSLTGLARRAVFDEHLRAEAARFSRSGGVFSVLMMDVDDFKRVNDRHGHAAGDAVLRAVADAVRGAVRESDTVARYGGEEIAVLLPATGIEGAAAAGEKLRAAVSALAVAAGAETLHVTVSIGAAEMEPGLDAAVLVARADEALYRAKAAGKNRVMLHAPPVTPKLKATEELEQAREVAEEREIEV